jgi:hypothetical protein
MTAMLSGKRILVAEDNDWTAAELVQMITDYRGVAHTEPDCQSACGNTGGQNCTPNNNQTFGIITISLGEANRLSAKLLALVRRWIAPSCPVRHQIARYRLIELSSTLHRLQPYRSWNRTDRRAVHGRCMSVPPCPPP